MVLTQTPFQSPRSAARREIRRTLAALGLALAGGAGVALEHGFGLEIRPGWLMPALQLVLAWSALVVAGDLEPLGSPKGGARWTTRTGLAGEGAVVLAGLLEVIGQAIGAELVAMGLAVGLAVRLNAQLARTMANPGLLFPASFLVLIGLSAVLLKLPLSTPGGQPINWVDAVFTATSAVCVTGLAVRDTGTGFTPFGQAVIGVSIQLGGLGMMIFGSTLALLFGARLSFRENLTLSMALSEYPAHRINRFVGFIVGTTLLIELAGAAVMFTLWPDGAALGWREQAGMAAFHSVSAFCNAGFDLTGQSLVGMRAHPLPYLAAMPLIVVGGLGFLVMDDVWRRARGPKGETRGAARRLTTHTKLVLCTTAALLAGGAVVIFLAQMKVPGLSIGQRVLDAAFMSTTARTAGFNTVPMDELAPGSRFMVMTLMTVGGSPGSTAGGIKTVVVAVLALAVWSTVRGRDEVEIFGRALPDALVKKAATVAFALLTLIAVVTLVLDLTESIAFEPLLFEVISAASTTGLSLGATGELTPVGRCVIAGTMFLGRVGLLAFLGALLVGGGGGRSYRYPRDSVSLG